MREQQIVDESIASIVARVFILYTRAGRPFSIASWRPRSAVPSTQSGVNNVAQIYSSKIEILSLPWGLWPGPIIARKTDVQLVVCQLPAAVAAFLSSMRINVCLSIAVRLVFYSLRAGKWTHGFIVTIFWMPVA